MVIAKQPEAAEEEKKPEEGSVNRGIMTMLLHRYVLLEN